MQSIVSDTTPLNYLVLIQAAEILPNLYGRVLIPSAVKAELSHANTPDIVRAWISQAPSWLEVVPLKQPVDSTLSHLDAGEGEAISLTRQLEATLLLMDERDVMFDRLRQTTFRSPLHLMASMLEHDAERKKRQEGR